MNGQRKDSKPTWKSCNSSVFVNREMHGVKTSDEFPWVQPINFWIDSKITAN